jgi:putative transposase
VLLKKDPNLSWLKDMPSQVLQQGLDDLDKAFSNFFRGIKNKEKIGYPKFKRKGVRDSFRYPQWVKVEGNKAYLPKIGWVCFRKSREIDGKIKQVTILRDGEKWYITFCCEIEKEVPKPVIDSKNRVGIDLGLTHFATLAIGEKNHHVTIENPKFLRKGLKKLIFLSSALSYKQKNGKNRGRARKKLNKFHSYLRHQRLDFFYKLALKIVKSHDIISVEVMNIKGMLQGLQNLSRAISDVGWRQFLNCLKNKAFEHGKILLEVSSLSASTSLCSNCGCKNKIALGQREYVCECGQKIDRDLNAAINIKAAGMSV